MTGLGGPILGAHHPQGDDRLGPHACIRGGQIPQGINDPQGDRAREVHGSHADLMHHGRITHVNGVAVEGATGEYITPLTIDVTAGEGGELCTLQKERT